VRLGRLLLGAGFLGALVLGAWAWWAREPSWPITHAPPAGRHVVAFGDSLTEGVGAGETGAGWPSRVAAMLGLQVENRGVAGDTTAAALARLERDVLALGPDVVIVGLGGNDVMRGVAPEVTRANLEAIVARLHEEGIVVVLLGFRFPLQSAYAREVRAVARARGCLLVPDVMDGLWGDRSRMSDSVHPNAAGYQVMAERIAEAIRPLWAG